jgi:hypothetical protein
MSSLGTKAPFVGYIIPVLNINVLEYNRIVGSRLYRLYTTIGCDLHVGDRVMLRCTRVSDGNSAGMCLVRYVAAIEPVCALLDDDDCVGIHLVPLKSMVKKKLKN